MKPSERLHENRDRVREIFARNKLRNPNLFGSAAKAQDGPMSDLDFLVETAPGISLFDLAAAEIELEQLLGCRIEVVTEGFLAPDVRERIKRDLMPLP